MGLSKEFVLSFTVPQFSTLVQLLCMGAQGKSRGGLTVRIWRAARLHILVDFPWVKQRTVVWNLFLLHQHVEFFENLVNSFLIFVYFYFLLGCGLVYLGFFLFGWVFGVFGEEGVWDFCGLFFVCFFLWSVFGFWFGFACCFFVLFLNNICIVSVVTRK